MKITNTGMNKKVEGSQSPPAIKEDNMNKLFDDVFSRICKNDFYDIYDERMYMRGMINMMAYLGNINGKLWYQLDQAINALFELKRGDE